MSRFFSIRKVYPCRVDNKNYNASAKIIFKTEESFWLNTSEPVVVPISIYSQFHNGIEGHMKMEGFISCIRANTKGEISVYLAENAHINTMSLIYNNSFEKCQKDAHNLVMRFNSVFEGLDIAYSDFVLQDEHYQYYKERILKMYSNDSLFQSLVQNHALSTYARERKELFPNKEAYIDRSIYDIIEQCTTLLVFESKGYRFLFYPGQHEKSVLYVLQGKKLSLIATHISVNNKKIRTK